jgi:hypothetical protein
VIAEQGAIAPQLGPYRQIRTAVGCAEEIRSSVWTMSSSPAGDVYLAARGMGRWLKVSLHASGRWRIAETAESASEGSVLSGGDDRTIRRWRRPPSFTSGWTKAFDVSILGAAELKAPVRHVMHKPRRPIDWLPVPLRGHKCTLTVLLSEPAVPVGDWERVIRQGDLTCGHLDLGPRGRAWMMVRYEQMNDDEKEYTAGLLGDMRINYESDPGDVEGAILSVELSGEPMIANTALGWEHVYVDGRPFRHDQPRT